MRPFFLFVLYVAALFVGGAALEYPLYRLLQGLSVEVGYWSLSGRLTLPLGVLTLYPFLRWMGLAEARSLGYGVPPRRWLAALMTGWLVGVAIMLPLAAGLLLLGVRGYVGLPGGVGLVDVVAGALLSGLAVALIEETFFRGGMFSAVQRARGVGAAAILTSVLYALVHFVDSDLRVPDEEIGWSTGLVVLAHSLGSFLEPGVIVDSALALFAAGLLLALVRARHGHIGHCVGIHAGWVFSIKLIKKAAPVRPEGLEAGWVGGYDQVIGWLAFCWLALLCAAYLAWGRFRASPAPAGGAT